MASRIVGSEDVAELRQKVAGEEAVLDVPSERALRAALMPGIRFLDARCGPVVHDAAIPRKFRGVGLGFPEPVDGGIHGGGVHAGQNNWLKPK